jgi:hypothetical protein
MSSQRPRSARPPPPAASVMVSCRGLRAMFAPHEKTAGSQGGIVERAVCSEPSSPRCAQLDVDAHRGEWSVCWPRTSSSRLEIRPAHAGSRDRLRYRRGRPARSPPPPRPRAAPGATTCRQSHPRPRGVLRSGQRGVGFLSPLPKGETHHHLRNSRARFRTPANSRNQAPGPPTVAAPLPAGPTSIVWCPVDSC